MNFYTVVYTGA